MSEDTVSYWKERALDAESELKFIKSEYGDADTDELTRDALALKVRVLEGRIKDSHNVPVSVPIAQLQRVCDEARRLVNSGYRGTFEGGAVDPLVHAVRAYEDVTVNREAARQEREKLLRELEVLRKALQRVTTGVLRQKALRSSCEASVNGVYCVHLRENDWDRLYALCKDTEVEIP